MFLAALSCGEEANVIEVSQGEAFDVTLKSNATTGYSWQLAKPIDNKILKFVNSRYVVGKKRLPGAGGKEIWTFRTISTGKTDIFFKYVRPWEKDMPPAEKESFLVNIKE